MGIRFITINVDGSVLRTAYSKIFDDLNSIKMVETSLIIRTNNEERWISKCLKSINR